LRAVPASAGSVRYLRDGVRRILVIGPGGAGKSTFARRLGERTGLPVVHLDALYWRPGWVKTPDDEWRATVAELLARDAWILDGNYSGTLDLRLAACDTVFFLDLPRRVCLPAVVARRIRFVGRVRPDCAPGCPEKLDLGFLEWIWTYPAKRRPKVLAKLAALRADQRAVVLRSRREMAAWLTSRSAAPPAAR
jgi:adenylate kinase family enzyme